MAVGRRRHGSAALLIAPPHKTPSEILDVEAEDVADVAKAARPRDVVGHDPFLGLAEQSLTATAGAADVALKGDDGFLEHGKQEALLGHGRRVHPAVGEQLVGEDGFGLEREAGAGLHGSSSDGAPRTMSLGTDQLQDPAAPRGNLL